MTHTESRQLNEKIVRLRDQEGLTNEQIGERLGMNASTVAQRYKRHKQNLKVKT